MSNNLSTVQQTGKKIKTPSFFLDEYQAGLDQRFPETIEVMSKQVNAVKDKTFKALSRGSDIMKAIDKARVANEQDPTQNEIGSKANTYRYADSKIKEMQSIFSNVEDDIREVANTLDQEVNKPISKSAIQAPFAKEARAHVKSLNNDAERRSFIRSAINEGDYETVEAVLGAPAYLSGLDKEAQANFLKQYKRTRFSNEIQTRDALQHLQSIVGKAYAASQENIRKLKTHEVEKAIQKQNASRRAMEV